MEKEFFDICFDELSNKNLMVQMVSQELALFKGAGSGLINIVGEDKAGFLIRVENYFLMRDFLHQLNRKIFCLLNLMQLNICSIYLNRLDPLF